MGSNFTIFSVVRKIGRYTICFDYLRVVFKLGGYGLLLILKMRIDKLMGAFRRWAEAIIATVGRMQFEALYTAEPAHTAHFQSLTGRVVLDGLF